MYWSEEVLLAERAVALVARLKPLSDASHVEFVSAILARHSREALVSWVEHAVADHAILNTLNLFVDVALPKEDCRNNVSVSQLKQVLDGEDPLVLLSLGDLELLADLNDHRLHGVVGRNHELELHRHLSLGVLSHEFLGGLEEREGEALSLATLVQGDLRDLNFLDLVVQDGW